MKVISTDARTSLPAKSGQAEILNSFLAKYPELTLCARFLTHHFSSYTDSWPTQALISVGKSDLLASYSGTECDQFKSGCTQFYKDIIRGDQHVWTKGKVFGVFYDSKNNHIYPVWWPGVWNVVCISVSQEYIEININGRLVWQTQDFAEKFIKTSKV